MNQTKFATGYVQKAASSSDHDGKFVLSEEVADRVGDIIKIDGWDLKNFSKNPVVLYQHDALRPIGFWKNVRVEGKKLVGEMKLASTNLARMAKQLIEDGVLRAVSVGFRPIEYEPLEKGNPYGGYLFKRVELLEASLVSVPALPSALLMAKSLGLSPEEQKLIFAGASKSPAASAASGIHPSVQRALDAREAARKLLVPRS